MDNLYGCIINVPIYANKLCFNNIQSAPAYSQLAAILASFVFAAIILALGTPPKNKTVQDISLPLTLSFGAFISLLVSCYLYATLAGEETQVVAFVFAYAPSFIFTLAALQLVLSIAWYFKTYDVKPGVIKAANWLVEIVLFILVIHLIAISGDLRIITMSASWDQAWFNTSWLNIWVILSLQIALLYAVPSLIARLVRKKVANLKKQTWYSRLLEEDCSTPYEKLCGITVFIFIGLTVFFSIYAAVVAEIDEQTMKKAIGTIQNFHGIEIILCFIFLIFALFVFLYQLSLPSSKEDPKKSAEQTKEEVLTQTLTQEVKALQALTSELIKQVEDIQTLHQTSPHQSTTEKNVLNFLSNLLVGFSIVSWVTRVLIVGRTKRKPH
jgi:hypothetical protein